ncbi:MAG: right-handed parallel beta-helix repeat-containing protein [Thermoplasmatales archaeon]|nr:right-handed parallel beta-helix repeat-containing protein [Thermoplasmatales archaeon]
MDMKKAVIIWLGIALVLSGVIVFVGIGKASNEVNEINEVSVSSAKTLTSRAPIYIDGNAGFTKPDPVNGGGTGTVNDPYIIENYTISASTAHGIFIDNTDVYFIIRNCVIHDGKSNDRHGIYFYSVANGKIDNVTSYNNDDGIYLYSSSNNNITNNQIYNNDHGVYLWDSSNNNISANEIYNNNYYGIYLEQYSSNNIITANQIYYHSNDGIYLWYSSNTNITANQIYNNYDGIRFGSYSNNNIISGNQIYNNDYHGIRLSWYSSNNNIISGNQIYNNDYDGIYISSSSDNNISANQVYNNSGYGIYLKESSDNEIHYNNIYNNTNYGVYNYNVESTYRVNATYNYWGSSDGPSGVGPGSGDNITSNVLYDPWFTSAERIYLYHTPIYINGNSQFTSENGVSNPGAAGTEADPYIIENWDIDASTAHGIYIENTDVYFIIRNCVIHDGYDPYNYIYNNGIRFSTVINGEIENCAAYNNYDSIALYSSSNNNLTSNQIHSNNHEGIYLDRYSSNNNITANQIYNNPWSVYLDRYSSNNNITVNQIYNNSYGIYLDCFSNNNNIISNQIYNNSGDSIYLKGSNHNIIANQIYHNSHGIYLDESSNNNIIANQIYHNSDDGIYLQYSADNNIITSNQIYNNSYGIYLKLSSKNEIHYNNIYDNMGYGIYNCESEAEYYGNAINNWWGSTDGPGGVGPGTGDNITSNVLYDPWLTEPHVNLPPVAYIDSISPNPAVEGDTITFTGHGYDTDGYVVAYSWSSDMDGFLSDQTSFSTSTLSVSEHTIYFKVQDNNGTWSTEVNGTLVINSTPLSLTVTVNANPTTLNSGETSTITVTVTDGTNPVSGATVNLASNNGGSFTSVTDNDNGTYTATFTTPTVTTQTICRITAEVTKTGYDSGSGYVDVTVNPVIQPTLTVTVSANPTTVSSDETSTITITVTDGTNPIAGTIVSLQSDNGGSFSSVTDNGGTYTATFTAPTVSSQTVCGVTANATKTGYTSGSNYVNVTVNPVGVENHAPVISGVPEQFGVEDIAWILDVTPYIDDIDNITEDLMITVNSSYVTVDGKILTFLYPNGIITDSVKITVSDGMATANQTITVTIMPVNDAPVINSFSPIDNPSIDEGEQQTFAVTASDVDNANLTIQWYLDDNLVETGGGSGIAISCTDTYVADYTSAGTYTVKVVVSDGSLTDEKTWSLTVNDVAGAGAEPEKKEEKGFIPGFETFILIVVLGGCAILLKNRKRFQ